jgi:Bifunctional DNA primase/polymerase, N-terminal
MTTPTMEAAVRLAERGIAVFPLRPRTKQPYGRTVGLHMASADVRTARERWAGRWMLPLQPIEKLREKNPGKSDDWLLRPVKAQPSANVAIATGASAGFWVLDEDGPEASAWIAAREAEHGPLPDTVEQQTARGRHRCFLWNDEAAAADISNRSQLSGAPLDVRGEGGYIVVAPSIHPGDAKKGVPPGFVYRWRPGHAPWEMDFAPAPAWLIALVKARRRWIGRWRPFRRPVSGRATAPCIPPVARSGGWSPAARSTRPMRGRRWRMRAGCMCPAP